MKRGFTLVELLITMAIIGLLTGLLVTNVSRSLSVNKLSDDVTVIESKIEYVRLLAGSNQQSTSAPGLQTDVDSAYYALYLPAGTNQTSYKIVRISSNLSGGICGPSFAPTNINCLVEQDQLSSGVTMTNLSSGSTFIAFKAPIKELIGIVPFGPVWQTATPNFTSPLFRLTFNGRTATVSVNNFTGKLTTVYN